MSRTGRSRRLLRRLLLVGGLLPVLAVLLGGSASAHPLGNFTVNQYSGLQISRDEVRVDYVLDLAEIPTFQARAATDRDGDGTVSPAELRAYAGRTCAGSVRHLDLRFAGRSVPLRVGAAAATQPPGQAGLPTTRVSCALRAAVPVRGRTAVTYADANLGDRVGWREITAVGDGTTVIGSSVPARTVSRRLSAYPKDLLKSPLDVRTARLTVRPGGAAADGSGGAAATSILPRGVDSLTTAFSEFVGRRHLGPGLGLLAVGLALLLGAAHALAPGHGKTVMAAFLLGRGSSLRAALTVGATVTATHTVGVLCLGIVLSLSSTLASEQVLPYLGLLSGLMLAAIGGQLLRSALAGRSAHDHGPGGHSHGATGHDHGPAGHDHGGGGHRAAAAAAGHPAAMTATGPAQLGAAVALAEHEHPHDHYPHDHHPHPHGAVAVPSRRSLVAMGVAGGLVPSPSALVVLLGAIALHRAWFGVLLVVCYGLGMAATLTAAGLLLVRARALLTRPHRAVRLALLQRAIPVLTAVVIIGVGLVLSVRAASVAMGSF